VLRGKTTGRITNGLIELYARRLAEHRASITVAFMSNGSASSPRRESVITCSSRQSIGRPSKRFAMQCGLWIPPMGACLTLAKRHSLVLRSGSRGSAAALQSRFPKGSRFDFEDAWQFVVDEQPAV